MNAEQEKAWEEWVSTRPPAIQAIARKYPPNCYRYQLGHYRLLAYEEPKDPAAKLTVKVLHGQDSFLPGITVFGFDPERLTPCGCGEWKPAERFEVISTLLAIKNHPIRKERLRKGKPATQ